MLHYFSNLSSSIYKKVVVAFLLVLTPIYLVCAGISVFGSTFIRNQISESVLSKVDFYAKNFEGEMGRIKTQQLQLLQDNDVNELGIASTMMFTFEKVQIINRISHRLKTIKSSSDYIENAGVYIKSLGKTISTGDGIRNIPNQEYEIIQQYMNSNETRFIFYHYDKLYSIIGSKEGKYVSYIELSRNKILDTLKQLENSNGIRAFLIDESGWDISNDDAYEIVKTIKDKGYFAQKAEMGDESLGKERIQDTIYWITYKKIGSFNMNLFACTDENYIIGPLKIFYYFFIILSLISCIVIVIFSFSLNRMIHKPLTKLMNAFKMVEAENLNLTINHERNDEFGYLYRGFNYMVERLKRSIQQVYEQRIAAQHSELKQLQSQINPHFLYNSFFHIYLMCKSEDYDNVASFSQKLGNYFQFITRSGMDEVPLHMEIKHAKNYTDIQTMRFGNRIAVKYGEIPDDCMNITIPRLTLQPVIENAYVHGLKNVMKDGIISTDIHFYNNIVKITIEDNGTDLEDAKLAEIQKKLQNPSASIEKTGIINVHKRIRIKFGDDSGINVTRGNSGGMKVEILINTKGMD